MNARLRTVATAHAHAKEKRPIQIGAAVTSVYAGTAVMTSTRLDAMTRTRSVHEGRAFCSRACFVAYNRVELPCEQCGALYVVQRHRMHAARFCKHSCYAEWLSQNRCGEMHPNWRGGWEPYYGSDWPRQRKACRERDAHTCRVCGATAEQVGSENIDVHHRIPFRTSHDNSLGNLVTLCDTCHHAVEAGRVQCPDA